MVYILDPLQRLICRLLRLLTDIIRTVAVHIYFAHIGVKSALLQQIHKKKCCRTVHRGKDTGSRRSTVLKILRKDPVGLLRIISFFEFSLLRERIYLKPLQKFHIHPKSPVGILRRMDMKIHKSRDDKTIAVIPDRIASQPERQCLINPVHSAVFTDKIAVFANSKLCLAFTVDNISF